MTVAILHCVGSCVYHASLEIYRKVYSTYCTHTNQYLQPDVCVILFSTVQQATHDVLSSQILVDEERG